MRRSVMMLIGAGITSGFLGEALHYPLVYQLGVTTGLILFGLGIIESIPRSPGSAPEPPQEPRKASGAPDASPDPSYTRGGRWHSDPRQSDVWIRGPRIQGVPPPTAQDIPPEPPASSGI